MNRGYGVILVDIRTVKVQDNLLNIYSESVAGFGAVGIVVYCKA